MIDHGGGKRRVVICGFAAKPSGVSADGFALSPYVPRGLQCRGARGNVGCRTNAKAVLHGPTADKHTLSLAPLPATFACLAVIRWNSAALLGLAFELFHRLDVERGRSAYAGLSQLDQVLQHNLTKRVTTVG